MRWQRVGLFFCCVVGLLRSFSHAVDSDDDGAVKDVKVEKFDFQAEVSRLMGMIVNSLYGQKEVFIRELVSNAADALEKIRFLSVEDPSVLGDQKEMQIVVDVDKEANTITVTDTGIGMTKMELINNLGTVAKSGTSNFLEAMAAGGDVNLIGQFGVGFYSAFLAADRVEVVSKSNEDSDQHIWESRADASFTVAVDPRGNTLGRGTQIILHLKEDAAELLDTQKMEDLLMKYSQFIQFPIYIRKDKTISEEVEIEPEMKDEKDEDDVDVVEDEEKSGGTKTMEKTVSELVQVNLQKAIWLRPKEEVMEEEYHNFYKALTKDYGNPPLAYSHFSAEGEIEFKSILFVPSTRQDDPYSAYFGNTQSIKLYVRRVLVAEEFDDLLPKWMNFVKGVIDSDDLPLKVDREQLAQHKVMKVISKRLTRKVLELLKKMRSDATKAQDALEELVNENSDKGELSEDDKEKKKALEEEIGKFDSFWKNFGKNVRLGCVEDEGGNRNKIARLLEFTTTKREKVTFDDYVESMAESQKNIYYITGDSIASMKKSPLLQMFLKKDIEVIMFADPLDDPCVQRLATFEGKKFTSIEKGDVKFDETEEEIDYRKKLAKFYEPLTNWWKTILPKDVMRVKVSNRLVDDPVTMVAASYGHSAYTTKVLKFQTFADEEQLKMYSMGKTLEINPQHPIIRTMLDEVKELGEDSDSTELKNQAKALIEAAQVASGFFLEDPTDMASRIYNMIEKELNVNKAKFSEPVDVSDVELDTSASSTPGEDDDMEEMPGMNMPGMDMPEGFDTSNINMDELLKQFQAQQKEGGDDASAKDEL